MYFAESVFDLMYLMFAGIVGLKLLVQKEAPARLFGLMALVLGLGDAFHLMPRVIAMWSAGGFAANAAVLSYGTLVSSITMTIFYLVFYRFYKVQSGQKNAAMDWIIYALAALRVALCLMPQNGWGQAENSYAWDLIRNIPFVLMGALLVVLFYRARRSPGMRNMALLSALSFLFYVPVVLFVRTIPELGALMIPKTLAYAAIVYLGFRHYVPAFRERSLLENAFVCLSMAMIAGVFYREFTKYHAFVGITSLGFVHGHLVALGMTVPLLSHALMRRGAAPSPDAAAKLARPSLLFNTGLFVSAIMMLLRGIIQVMGDRIDRVSNAMLSGFAGMGHIALASGALWLALRFLRDFDEGKSLN